MLTCKITLPDALHPVISKNPGFGALYLARQNEFHIFHLINTKNVFFSFLAAGFWPKNLAFARKIMVLPESGGLRPQSPWLVRLWILLQLDIHISQGNAPLHLRWGVTASTVPGRMQPWKIIEIGIHLFFYQELIPYPSAYSSRTLLLSGRHYSKKPKAPSSPVGSGCSLAGSRIVLHASTDWVRFCIQAWFVNVESLHSNCRASSLTYIETTHIVMTSTHTVISGFLWCSKK